MLSLNTIYLVRLLLGVFAQTSVCVCSLHPNGNLNLTSRVEAILSLVPQDRAHEPHYVDEREIRDLLDDCVAAVNADPSNHSNNENLLNILQVVTDDQQRLNLFKDVARGLVEAGSQEEAGLLGINLAEAMDKDGRSGDPVVQEALLRYSIRVFPADPFAIRSLGYRLEQRGEELRAMKLYREGLETNPDRLDLRLLLAASCSPFLDDAEQGDERFLRVSREMDRLRQDIQTRGRPFRKLLSPGRNLAYMPSFSWQYIGRNMRPLMEALCWVLAAMTAGLHDVGSKSLHPWIGWNSSVSATKEGDGSRNVVERVDATHQEVTNRELRAREKGGQERITIGVVMERRDNHSPHRLIQGVVEGIDRSKFRVVVFIREDGSKYPPAGKAIVEAADKVLVLPWHPFVKGLPEPFAERKVVTMAQVDVLLYMALGNTLGSHLLALGRLAPIQVAFGHGHPVTSGSPAIDYFVSSSLFETQASIDAREARSIMGISRDIAYAAAVTKTPLDLLVPWTGEGDHNTAGWKRRQCVESSSETEKCVTMSTPRRARGDGTQDYTEQLVLFDSLTASLPQPFGPLHAPSAAKRIAQAVTAGLIQDGDHLYHCIQHSKKFHPYFDDVLRGVLLADRAAKILLTRSSKIHLSRWERTLGPDLIPRLVFLPYLPHSEMLLVVGSCCVMLDTFPWGAGVTSMEALSQGVPVVTLPDRISVLQLAAGQLSELGVQEELVASDVEDMITKATRLASDSSYRANLSTAIVARKAAISDPRAAIKEWEQFLQRAVKSVVHPVMQTQDLLI